MFALIDEWSGDNFNNAAVLRRTSYLNKTTPNIKTTVASIAEQIAGKTQSGMTRRMDLLPIQCSYDLAYTEPGCCFNSAIWLSRAAMISACFPLGTANLISMGINETGVA
jgi:hypothetical protein